MARLVRLEGMREMGYEMARRLNDYVAGRLSPDECTAFADIKDPTLAFSRMTSTVRRIIALEERLDEDAETRETRIAAEQAERARKIAAEEAARQQAIRNAEAARVREAAEAPLREKKQLVRHGLHEASFDMDDDLNHEDRESLLDDLFDQYEIYDDYAGDPDEILAQLIGELEKQLGDLTPDSASGLKAVSTAASPEEFEAGMLALARAYLDRVAPKKPPDH